MTQSAVNFLKDSRIRHATTESKVRFLKNKGLSDAQILTAFRDAGLTISPSDVTAVQESQPPAVSMRNALLSTSSTPSRVHTHTLFPSNPIATPAPVEKGFDWRDAVIGVGAATLAAVGAVKLFQKYSPYELRRKRPQGCPSTRMISRMRQIGPPIDGDMDCLRPSSMMPVGQAVPLPAVPAAVAAAGSEGELEKVKKELADVKVALEKERKRCGELSINLAKVRQEKQQLANKTEQLSRQLDEVEERRAAEEAEAQKRESEGVASPIAPESLDSTTEAPEGALSEVQTAETASPAAPQTPPTTPIQVKEPTPLSAASAADCHAADPVVEPMTEPAAPQ